MTEKNLNALEALILSGILFGALYLQIFNHEVPCPLCLLQRIGMLGVAASVLLNLRFGIQKAHYALAILFAVFGGFIALRQMALHACPNFPTFGIPFWGLSLYTWSFIIFGTSIIYNALLMLIFNSKIESKAMNWWCHLAFYAIFTVAFINILTTYQICSFGLCSE